MASVAPIIPAAVAAEAITVVNSTAVTIRRATECTRTVIVAAGGDSLASVYFYKF